MHSSSDDLTASSYKCGRIFNFSLTSPFTAAAKSHREFLDTKIKEYSDVFRMEEEIETPMERLKDCLKRILIGASWETELVQGTFIASTSIGFIIGSLVREKGRVEAFGKKFNNLQFEGEFKTSRKLADVILTSTLKRVSSIAVKFAFLPTVTVAGFTCSLAYRNYVNPLDFAVLVGLASVVYKIHLGGKAMLSAFTVGSALGLVIGCIAWSIFKFSRMTVAEYRFWSKNHHRRMREQLSDVSWEQWSKKMESLKLAREHDKVSEKIISQPQTEK